MINNSWTQGEQNNLRKSIQLSWASVYFMMRWPCFEPGKEGLISNDVNNLTGILMKFDIGNYCV